MYPKVLIVAHNALSDTQNNGKTISGFFHGWDQSKLAQIYLTSDIPDFTVCELFFQINDFDIAKRLTLRRSVQGRKVTRKNISEIRIDKKKAGTNPVPPVIKRLFSTLIRLVRDCMWHLAGFRTMAMRKFILEFEPQIVFFQSSNSSYAFSLVRWICRTERIPLVMQITDDYITPRFSISPFFWIQHYRLLKRYKWAFSVAEHVIVVGEKMAQEYQVRFGGIYSVAMNTSFNLNLPEYYAQDRPVQLLYAGNLGLNRWKVLATVAQCLRELHREEGILSQLSIYSLVMPSSRELRVLNLGIYSRYLGSVNSLELNILKSDSDILLHVEAFDRVNRHITRLSISTKIPEYLASGRCILAIGPRGIASIDYILDSDLGFVITSSKKDVIRRNLKMIVLDYTRRKKYARRGPYIAEQRHSIITTSAHIHRIIVEAIGPRISEF